MASGGIWEHLGDMWRHLRTPGSIWEASGWHLGGIWEAWEASGSKIVCIRGHLGAPGRQMCSNTCVLSAKVARGTISRARDERRCHRLPRLRSTFGGRGPGAYPRHLPLATKTIRQRKHCLGNVAKKVVLGLPEPCRVHLRGFYIGHLSRKELRNMS